MQTTRTLYHGGNLDATLITGGLWATADVAAARDYADDNDGTLWRIIPPEGARIITVEEAAKIMGIPRIITEVAAGNPAYLAENVNAATLEPHDVWGIAVAGDESTGPAMLTHDSVLVVGAYDVEDVEEAQ